MIKPERLKLLVQLEKCDYKMTQTHNHLVCKQTLSRLATLAKWMNCVVSTYMCGAFDCLFLSYQVRVSEWIHTL